jgi:hypothetical protein
VHHAQRSAHRTQTTTHAGDATPNVGYSSRAGGQPAPAVAETTTHRAPGSHHLGQRPAISPNMIAYGGCTTHDRAQRTASLRHATPTARHIIAHVWQLTSAVGQTTTNQSHTVG